LNEDRRGTGAIASAKPPIAANMGPGYQPEDA
jgi:hypothetical protein